MAFQALIFDHDGTLVDSEALHLACWQQVMSTHGVTVTEQEYIEHHNGIPTLQNAQVFIDTYHLALSADELAADKSALFAVRAERVPPKLMPTTLETLEAASQGGFKTAIATGAGREDLERSMRAHGFHSLVQATATRNDVQAGKPAPDVYLLACELLGVAPAKACAFEDTAAGIASAKAAGLVCFAVPNAYSMRQDLSAADACCENLCAALKLAQCNN